MHPRGFSPTRPRLNLTPPTPISGTRRSTRRKVSASIFVEGAKSGFPDNPPVSLASAVSFRFCGRAIVVFETVSPSILRPRAVFTIASSPSSDRSGAIFNRTIVCATSLIGGVARVDAAAQKIVQKRLALQIAQARRVRRRNVDGDEIDEAAQSSRMQSHIIGDAILKVLVGADVHADDAGPSCPS